MTATISTLFHTPFLKEFTLTSSLLPFSDSELAGVDHELAVYEKVYLDPDVEKYLYSKNELMASFAISKAENSTLTIAEAQQVYNFVIENKELSFISEKLNNNQELTEKDFEKLEFYNIVRVFRKINKDTFTIDQLNQNFIKLVHADLTAGFDIFSTKLLGFTVYKSGMWRDNNNIIVGSYVPAPHQEISEGVCELIEFIKTNYTITNVGIFHTSLYALHPFNNGNKRVCRVLEHVLLRGLGVNTQNLYSTSYYYHKEKERYYKYLLASLERRNLTYFASFFQEALFLSIVSTVKTSLEMKRYEFITGKELNDQINLIIKPLIKKKELQYKHLRKLVVKKMAEQTFVTYLQQAVDKNIITKRGVGRSVFYQINLDSEEENIISKWLELGKKKLSYIPDSIKLS